MIVLNCTVSTIFKIIYRENSMLQQNKNDMIQQNEQQELLKGITLAARFDIKAFADKK